MPTEGYANRGRGTLAYVSSQQAGSTQPGSNGSTELKPSPRPVARCYVSAYDGSSGGGGQARSPAHGAAHGTGTPAGPKSEALAYRKRAQLNSYAASKAATTTNNNAPALSTRKSAPMPHNTTASPSRGYSQRAQLKAKQQVKVQLPAEPSRDASTVGPASTVGDVASEVCSQQQPPAPVVLTQPDWEQLLPWEKLAAESSGDSSVFMGIDTSTISSPTKGVGYAQLHNSRLTHERQPLLHPCEWEAIADSSPRHCALRTSASEPCPHISSPVNSATSSGSTVSQAGDLFGADSCSSTASDAGALSICAEQACLSPSEVQPLLTPDQSGAHSSGDLGPALQPSTATPQLESDLQPKQQLRSQFSVSVMDTHLVQMPIEARVPPVAAPPPAVQPESQCQTPTTLSLPPRPSGFVPSPKTPASMTTNVSSTRGTVSVPTSMGGSRGVLFPGGTSATSSSRGAASVPTSWGGSRAAKPLVFDEQHLIVPSESDDDVDEDMTVCPRVPSVTISELRGEISTLTAAWQQDVKEKMFLKQALAAGEATLLQVKHQCTAETEVAKLRMRIAEEGERHAMSKLQAAQSRISQLATELNVAKRQITSLEDEVHRLTTKLHQATHGHDLGKRPLSIARNSNSHFQFFNSVFNAPMVNSGHSPRCLTLADTLHEISLMQEGAMSPKGDQPKSPAGGVQGVQGEEASLMRPSTTESASVQEDTPNKQPATTAVTTTASVLSSVKGAVDVITKGSRALSAKTLNSFKRKGTEGGGEAVGMASPSRSEEQLVVSHGIGRSTSSCPGVERTASAPGVMLEASESSGARKAAWSLGRLCGVVPKQQA